MNATSTAAKKRVRQPACLRKLLDGTMSELQAKAALDMRDYLSSFTNEPWRKAFANEYLNAVNTHSKFIANFTHRLVWEILVARVPLTNEMLADCINKLRAAEGDPRWGKALAAVATRYSTSVECLSPDSIPARLHREAYGHLQAAILRGWQGRFTIHQLWTDLYDRTGALIATREGKNGK